MKLSPLTASIIFCFFAITAGSLMILHLGTEIINKNQQIVSPETNDHSYQSHSSQSQSIDSETLVKLISQQKNDEQNSLKQEFHSIKTTPFGLTFETYQWHPKIDPSKACIIARFENSPHTSMTCFEADLTPSVSADEPFNLPKDSGDQE